MVNFGELMAEIGWSLGHPSKFQRFASWLRYCTGGGCCPVKEVCQVQIHFASKSCVLYCQRYCTALEQWASAKLYGVVQGTELWNFRRGHHLYSAGRPSRWASAHILVCIWWWTHDNICLRQNLLLLPKLSFCGHWFSACSFDKTASQSVIKLNFDNAQQ